MQLSQRVGVKELEEFLSQAGKVKHVKLIADKNSRRSKGIAYVEFVEEGSVQLAMGMSGQKLFGVPIMLQPTMAEKNRAAANAENLKKPDGPRKLYVGNLHPNINEIMLKAVFEPFGMLDQVKVQREADGNSKGYGFVEFKSPEVADNAMKHLNGFELANQPIRVNYVNERTADMESLDTQDIDVGVGMTATSRASLMAKLSEGHKAGLTVPGLPQQSGPSTISSCLVLQNMFDPTIESGAGWKEDVRDDVLLEVSKFGAVFHIHVDATSPQGCVYVKCQAPQVASAAVSTLHGRKYGGKEIKAQCMPEAQYHGIFPMAMSAMIPLRPSS